MAMEIIKARLEAGLTDQIAKTTIQAAEAFQNGDIDGGRALLERATGYNTLLHEAEGHLRAIDSGYQDRGLPVPPAELLGTQTDSQPAPAQPKSDPEIDDFALPTRDPEVDPDVSRRFAQMFEDEVEEPGLADGRQGDPEDEIPEPTPLDQRIVPVVGDPFSTEAIREKPKYSKSTLMRPIKPDQQRLIQILFQADEAGKAMYGTFDDIIRAYDPEEYQLGLIHRNRQHDLGKLRGSTKNAIKGVLSRLQARSDGQKIHPSWQKAFDELPTFVGEMDIDQQIRFAYRISETQEALEQRQRMAASALDKALGGTTEKAATSVVVFDAGTTPKKPTPNSEGSVDTKIEPLGEKQIQLLLARFTTDEEGLVFKEAQQIATQMYPERTAEALNEPSIEKRTKLLRRIMEDYEKTLKGIEARFRLMIDNPNASRPENINDFLDSIAGNPLTAHLSMEQILSILKFEPGSNNLINPSDISDNPTHRPTPQANEPISTTRPTPELRPDSSGSSLSYEFSDGETIYFTEKDLAEFLRLFESRDSWTIEELAKEYANDSSRSGQRQTFVMLERLRKFLSESSTKKIRADRAKEKNERHARFRIITSESDETTTATPEPEIVPKETAAIRPTQIISTPDLNGSRQLTSLEKQVLMAMRDRLPDKQIATRFKVTPDRLRAIIDGIYSTLGSSHTWNDAVLTAERTGQIKRN